MQLNTLKRKNSNKKSAAVGRGGKRGKTAGRGTKGQNARAGRKKRPEMRDIIKRIPKLRGRGKNSNISIQAKPFVVNLVDLERRFQSGDIVSPQTLLEKGLISKAIKESRIKILGNGELSKKLTIEGCEVSGSAKEKILASGGIVK
jgi:large subunit ribosomal protein L15